MWSYIRFMVLCKSYQEHISPSKIFFKDFAYILRTPFSTIRLNGCFHKSIPDIWSFALRFVKVIYGKFLSFCAEVEHSRGILLPDILLSVLQFFNFIWFYYFYSTKSKLLSYLSNFWNLLYVLFWKFAVCSFSIFDWLKTPAQLFFEKDHVVNQKSRALSDFLKIEYD